MITGHQVREKAYQRYAWVILLLVNTLLAVNVAVVAAVDRATAFQGDTGVLWQEFTVAYPSVANAYMLNLWLLSVVYTGLALFALIITYFGFRQGQRWAWFAMWLLGAVLTLTAILFNPLKRPDPGMTYAAFAAVTVIGLLLPIRKFFPKQS